VDKAPKKKGHTWGFFGGFPPPPPPFFLEKSNWEFSGKKLKNPLKPENGQKNLGKKKKKFSRKSKNLEKKIFFNQKKAKFLKKKKKCKNKKSEIFKGLVFFFPGNKKKKQRGPP